MCQNEKNSLVRVDPSNSLIELLLNSIYDFNFRPYQKVKFQNFIKYFDWLEAQAEIKQNSPNHDGDGGSSVTDGEIVSNEKPTTDLNETTVTDDYLKISRKVFSGKQWLTIEDWLECSIPLCALDVKHEGRIERSHDTIVQTVFASPRLGGDILSSGWSQVSMKKEKKKNHLK